jgi:FSR family fosmidomycin resistance protein-like MFS transporter
MNASCLRSGERRSLYSTCVSLTKKMSLLLDTIFSSIAFGHLIVDVLNGQRAVLLAFLSGPLGLSNAELGLISTLYVMAGALSQPLFGLLTDRFGARWVAAGGVLAMAIFFSLALVIPGTGALYLLMLASLGSGAFHPAGTMQATLRGRSHFSGRDTTSAAYFFFFGQAGAFLGPMLGGPLLDRFGPVGLLLLTSLAVPVGMNTAQQLRSQVALPAVLASRPPMRFDRATLGRRILPLSAFALLAALQAWSQQNMITFLPKYQHDLGVAAGIYGLTVSMFYGGSAVGNALGGILADRFGKRNVSVCALGLAAVPLYLISIAEGTTWMFILAALSGLLTGAVHSSLVVLAQRHIPGGMAFASGLILGFMFSSGALGTFFSGYLADLWGFPPVFQMTAGLSLAAALMAMTLRER